MSTNIATVVAPGAERAVGREDGEAEALPCGRRRWRDRRDAAVQREREPVPTATRERCRRAATGSAASSSAARARACCRSCRRRLLVELRRRRAGVGPAGRRAPVPPGACELRPPVAGAEERDLARERSPALRERGRVGCPARSDLDDVRAAAAPSTERPVVFHGSSTPSTSAIVGRMSYVVTCLSTTRPCVCPGSFTKSGMNARSARFVARRLPALVAAAEADRRGRGRRRRAPCSRGRPPAAGRSGGRAARRCSRPAAGVAATPAPRAARVPPELVRAPGRARVRDRTHAAVREVQPRPVRHQDVQEVERRLVAGRRAIDARKRLKSLHAPDIEGVQVHLRQLGLSSSSLAGVGAEVPPRLVDRGQPVLERRRREQVEVDDRARPSRATTAATRRLGLALADARRAEPRLRLGRRSCR